MTKEQYESLARLLKDTTAFGKAEYWRVREQFEKLNHALK